MPIYEFECPIHGVFEEILPLISANLKFIQCALRVDKQNFCYEVAARVWSLPSYPSHGKPTIIFKNPKTGETEVALHEHQKAPDGFIKEELKTPYERSKFEKEETQNQRIEDEYKTEERRF